MSRTHHTWLHLPESLIFLAMTSLPVLTSSSSFPPLSSSFVIPRHLYTEHVFVFLCYQHITVPCILQVVFEHLFLCIFYIIKRFSRKLDFPMTQKKNGQFPSRSHSTVLCLNFRTCSAPSQSRILILRILPDYSSAISMHPRTSHGYRVLPSSQALSLL